MVDLPDETIQRIREAEKVVVLTGAGISAESGVPTFRGPGGYWKNHRPEELATPEAFERDPRLVWEWYQYRRDLISGIEPNPGHYALAELERLAPVFHLITQNVDGLHRRAGNSDPIEVHGNIMLTKCVSCSRIYPEIETVDPENIPRCKCGAYVRPNVVWFGEMLPEEAMTRAQAVSSQAEVFFSIGTSALVYPAAYYPVIAKQNGALLIEINIESTPLTAECDLFLQGKSGNILPQILSMVWK